MDDYVTDTMVLRYFASAERLDLLRAFQPVHTTRRVLGEIERCKVAPVIKAVEQAQKDGWLMPAKPATLEAIRQVATSGGRVLGDTDTEVIATGLSHAMVVLCDERRMLTLAERNGVGTLNVVEILEALKDAEAIQDGKAMHEVIFRLESMAGKTFRPPDRDKLLRY